MSAITPEQIVAVIAVFLIPVLAAFFKATGIGNPEKQYVEYGLAAIVAYLALVVTHTIVWFPGFGQDPIAWIAALGQFVAPIVALALLVYNVFQQQLTAVRAKFSAYAPLVAPGTFIFSFARVGLVVIGAGVLVGIRTLPAADQIVAVIAAFLIPVLGALFKAKGIGSPTKQYIEYGLAIVIAYGALVVTGQIAWFPAPATDPVVWVTQFGQYAAVVITLALVVYNLFESQITAIYFAYRADKNYSAYVAVKK